MYRFVIDTSEIADAIDAFESVQEIDTIKEVQWYINQVYRDLSKKHGRRYTYVTPPGRKRTNLRVHSRKLLNDLRNSRFVRKQGSSLVAGWSIGEGNPKGKYLGIHVDATLDGTARPYKNTPDKAKYTYTTRKGEKRILVPLRAGMDNYGRPKPITGRVRSTLRHAPFRMIKDRSDFNWSGEDKSKFNPNVVVLYKRNGRTNIPMYLIIKQATIPRRLKLGEAMELRRPDLFTRIESQIQKELNRVSKKRNRRRNR